jgi:UDP-glucose/galactose:(glucosyl)LPS alpha-1,2-glucosyl/galactosyltransferase
MFAYCSVCDDAYVPHLAATLASIAENGAKAPYFVISDGISGVNARKLSRFCASLGMEFTLIDGASEPINSLKTCGHVTRASWLKVFAPNMLPAEIKRMLFLDCDLIAIADVSKLTEMDMHGAVMCAARDPQNLIEENRRRLGLSQRATYVNTGVVLVDLDKWRSGNYTNKVHDFALRNPDKILLAEQCAVNAVLQAHIALLNGKWNYLVNFDWAEAPETDARILHFSGRQKPWNSKFVPGSEFFRHYARGTPWGDPTPPDCKAGNFDRIRRSINRIKLHVMQRVRWREASLDLMRMKAIDDRIEDLSVRYLSRTRVD